MLRRLSFNLWYFRNPPWDSGISPPELLEFIQTHPAGKAIDLGCGTGTNVITLQGKQDYLTQLKYILAPNGFWLLYAFLSPGTPRSGHGVAEAEIVSISSQLTLVSRRDGFDKRERTSAWFLFQKTPVG